MTETNNIIDQKNPETNLKRGICQWKHFDKNDILYTIEKILRSAFQIIFFRKQSLNSLPSKLETNLKHGICRKFFFNNTLLCIHRKSWKRQSFIKKPFFWVFKPINEDDANELYKEMESNDFNCEKDDKEIVQEFLELLHYLCYIWLKKYKRYWILPMSS